MNFKLTISLNAVSSVTRQRRSPRRCLHGIEPRSFEREPDDLADGRVIIGDQNAKDTHGAPQQNQRLVRMEVYEP